MLAGFRQHEANNGCLVVSWVFGPDQANLRDDDVDAFQLLGYVDRRHYPQVLLPQATLLNILIHGLSKPTASFGPTPIRTNVVQNQCESCAVVDPPR
jgi:hypothetical protein